jgi:hypothetical protein
MIDIDADELSKLIKCDSYHEYVPEYGDRAWIARGELADVIYWDSGNSWCSIMYVIVKKGDEAWLKELLKLDSTPKTMDI